MIELREWEIVKTKIRWQLREENNYFILLSSSNRIIHVTFVPKRRFRRSPSDGAFVYLVANSVLLKTILAN